MAQTHVKGTVVSAEDGEPIIGATVLAKGTTVGISTDIDGNFELNVPAGVKTLVVSFVGMNTQEVAVKPNVFVTLESDSQVLDDVMVVAYGTAKRSAFTGSAAEVKSEDITSHVASSATSAIVGKVAGVTATTGNGGPGSSPTIRIRGIGSMSASNDPLYIVDGAPLDGATADINPNDIESISVLKDASASAIYGARGANGVVIITTKSAKAGRDAEVNFDAKFGSNSRLVPNYDVITEPGEYYETAYKALYGSQYYHGASVGDAHAFANKNLLNQNNGGLGYLVYTLPQGENLVGTNFKLNPNAKLGYSDGQYYYTPDNWYDEAFSNSFRQEYNVSVKGTEGKLSYYAGLGYLKDGGMVTNSDYNRYTARANVTYQAKKWMKFSTNMSYTHTDRLNGGGVSSSYGSSGNLFYIANSMGPIYPLYVRNADGSLMKQDGRQIYDRNQTNFKRPSIVGNAFGDNEVDVKKSLRDVFMGKAQVDLTPVKGLTLTAALTAQNTTGRYNYLYSPFGSNAAYDGFASVGSDRMFSTNMQFLANYTATFAEKHNVSALVGYEQYNLKDQSIDASNSRLFSPFIGELDNALGKADMEASSSTDTYMTEGILGRVSYDYDERYFLSASIRRDASSRFAPGHRWGTFGSVGLAWQLTKESFMKDITWLDLLKLKASWGTQGNDDLLIGYHSYADRYSTAYNEETGEYTVKMYAKGNENLTWESSKAWNVGFDFSALKYRVNGTVEFYHRATADMLYSRRIPLSSGLAVNTYPVNVGSMFNRGIEITLDGSPIRTKNIDWNINMNLSFNHNEITELDPSIPETGLTGTGSIIKVGCTRYQTYMIKYAGVEPETGLAQYYMDVKDDDGNVTGQTTTTNYEKATKYDCGTTLPTVFGGFGTTLTAYGFDLAAQFTFQLGGQIYDGSYQRTMGYDPGSNMHKDLRRAWTEDNRDTDIPRWSSAVADDGFLVGSQTPIDFFLTSSNYLSLSNLTVGYTIPKKLAKKIAMSNLRIYFAGENLFLLTKRKGLDPRYSMGTGSMTSGTGMMSDAYSAGRSITGGISLTF